MSAHSYTILPEQAQEDALHAQRLLLVEERPFQRVKGNLLGSNSLIRWSPPKQLPSPPPDGDESSPVDSNGAEDRAKREKFREDILLDFAAVESSILRIQLIQACNARERQRYAAEKAKILEIAQGVRNNTLELRAQLAEAQRLLELRKGYDTLAAKLIDPKKLKPRAETREDIEKLEKEIEDLQQESADYDGVWLGRRDAFDRVVNEGESMIKVIKGIKDEPGPEPDKDERMDEGDEGESGAKDERSRIGTPIPEPGARTPMPETAPHTPRAITDIMDDESGPKQSSLTATPMLQAQADVDMREVDHPIATSLTETQNTSGPLETQSTTSQAMRFTAAQVAMPGESLDEGVVRVDELEAIEATEQHRLASAEDMDQT